MPVTSLRYIASPNIADEKNILIATYASGVVRTWHTTSNSCVRTITPALHENSLTALDLSADGRVCAVYSHTVRIHMRFLFLLYRQGCWFGLCAIHHRRDRWENHLLRPGAPTNVARVPCTRRAYESCLCRENVLHSRAQLLAHILI